MSIPTEYTIRLATENVGDALREHADRRLFFALRRFGDKVRNVAVRIVDLNGPRKGRDSRCTIMAQLSDSSSIVVEATTAWPTASITLACRRLNEAIRRHVAKARRRA
jgi:ribosome-associated translation inhibitor RaiA